MTAFLLEISELSVKCSFYWFKPKTHSLQDNAIRGHRRLRLSRLVASSVVSFDSDEIVRVSSVGRFFRIALHIINLSRAITSNHARQPHFISAASAGKCHVAHVRPHFAQTDNSIGIIYNDRLGEAWHCETTRNFASYERDYWRGSSIV